MKQHIHIRVTNCLECPLAETEKPLHASTIGSWPVRCNRIQANIGDINVCSKRICGQCPFPKITDIEDSLAD